MSDIFLIHSGTALSTLVWKGNIGNARLQGLQTQLHLTDNQYNIAVVSSVGPNTLLLLANNYNERLCTLLYVAQTPAIPYRNS